VGVRVVIEGKENCCQMKNVLIIEARIGGGHFNNMFVNFPATVEFAKLRPNCVNWISKEMPSNSKKVTDVDEAFGRGLQWNFMLSSMLGKGVPKSFMLNSAFGSGVLSSIIFGNGVLRSFMLNTAFGSGMLREFRLKSIFGSRRRGFGKC